MSPNNKRAVIWINQADEETAPPSSTVVGIEAIGDSLAIVFASENCDHKQVTYTTEHTAIVDLTTFIKALHATVDAELLIAVLRAAPTDQKQAGAA